MSLSDRERRLLAEMEAALATDDPRLESRLAGSTMTPAKPRLALGALSILAGVAILFAGLISQITPLGVAGFRSSRWRSSHCPFALSSDNKPCAS